jgi:hypothetical protein
LLKYAVCHFPPFSEATSLIKLIVADIFFSNMVTLANQVLTRVVWSLHPLLKELNWRKRKE